MATKISEERSGIPIDLRTVREVLGDVIEAILQLDMARESGGVVSHDVIERLDNWRWRRVAKPLDPASQGGA